MKYLLKYILAMLSIASLSANAQEKFAIDGYISGLPEGTKIKIYGLQMPLQTAIVSQGKFNLTGTLKEPMYVSISTTPDWAYEDGKLDIFYQNFFIDKGVTRIVGPSIAEATIEGGPTQKEFSDSGMGIYMDWVYAVALPLYASVKKQGDTVQINHLTLIKELRAERYRRARTAYITSHPDSYVSLRLVYDIINGLKPEEALTLYNGMTSKMKSTDLGKEVSRLLKLSNGLDVGKLAPEFTQPDASSRPIKLQNLRGKYVLVEFWASWCGPCRLGNPSLVKTYNKFKDKNFEIIGISLDDKKALWVKAIKDDSLPWINVSDLQKENAVAKAWGVQGVPNNFLLDTKGVIIAKDVSGEELEKELRTLLK